MDYVGIVKQCKLIDGKLYHRFFIDREGKEVGIPAGIYAIGNGKGHNYVINQRISKQFPGAPAISFRYSDKYTQEDAIKKMIAACSAMTNDQNRTCTNSRKRKSPKDLTPLGIQVDELPFGITFQNYNSNDTRLYVFGVSYFDRKKNGFRSTSIYCGTENTWRQNYAKKLKKAIALREESLEIYRQLTENQTQ
jgi:hypothetical protein